MVQDADKSDTADRSVSELESEADLTAHMQETERKAKARARALPARRPKDLKGIRDNHAQEKAERRRGEAFDLSGSDGDDIEAMPTKVIPIRPILAAKDDDFSEPSLSQRLRPKE